MECSAASSARDRDRTSALAAGLAATIISWTFAAAFTPEKLDSLSQYSPWLYGPAATAVWALFSAIAYFFIKRDRNRSAPVRSPEDYRCRDFAVMTFANGSSVCIDQEEKNRLGGVTGGFALTITGWVAALSVMPDHWLNWLSNAPASTYCVATIIVWAALTQAMYLIFRALNQNRVRSGARATDVRI
jgi:hypothetical protein